MLLIRRPIFPCEWKASGEKGNAWKKRFSLILVIFAPLFDSLVWTGFSRLQVGDIFPLTEILESNMPSKCGSLFPVKARCAVHRAIKYFTFSLLCNYCKDVTFNARFIWEARVLHNSGRERDPVINTRILCFSNFLEWLARPFDVPAAAEIQTQLWKGGKIRFTQPQAVLLSSVQKFYLDNWLQTFFCRAELVNRVSLQEYLGHDPNPSQGANRIHVAKTGIRKVLIVGKELFSLAFLIKTLVYHHT